MVYEIGVDAARVEPIRVKNDAIRTSRCFTFEIVLGPFQKIPSSTSKECRQIDDSFCSWT